MRYQGEKPFSRPVSHPEILLDLRDRGISDSTTANSLYAGEVSARDKASNSSTRTLITGQQEQESGDLHLSQMSCYCDIV